MRLAYRNAVSASKPKAAANTVAARWAWIRVNIAATLRGLRPLVNPILATAMLSITVTSTGASETRAFLVRVAGDLQQPRALNAELADCLKDRIIAHFTGRNQEPNKMEAAKTGFWEKAANLTMVKEITDTGATVQVGGDAHVRIHLLSGTVKPTGGKKFLTIPLIKEARGIRAAVYEETTGHKLFRPHGRMVLMERTDEGDENATGKASMKTKSGHRVFNLGGQVKVRAVYALAREATIPKDPRALPPEAELAAALQEAANAWAAREMKKGGAA